MGKIILTLFLSVNFGWIGLYAQQIPRDTSYNVQRVWEGTVKNYPEAKIASTNIPKEVVADLNVVYLEIPDTPYGDRALHADIFRPKKQGIYPALIMCMEEDGGLVTNHYNMLWPFAWRQKGL